MKIIIAPAKKMRVDTDSFEVNDLPQFLEQTQQILATMQKMSYEELKDLWNCSDKLAKQNYEILQRTDLNRSLTPAVMAYVGIQYQYMAPDLMTVEELTYLQANLRILSGFYGILKPFDGIVPYRLEMQAKLPVEGQLNLYRFWGSRLYEELYADDNHCVINLASKEYEKGVRPYLNEDDQLITCVFGELVNGKVKQKATAAKMARGEMVNYISHYKIDKLELLKGFNRLNYRYDETLSQPDTLVFIKENKIKN